MFGDKEPLLKKSVSPLMVHNLKCMILSVRINMHIPPPPPVYRELFCAID